MYRDCNVGGVAESGEKVRIGIGGQSKVKLSYHGPVWICRVHFYYVETLEQRYRGTPKDSQEAGGQ